LWHPFNLIDALPNKTAPNPESLIFVYSLTSELERATQSIGVDVLEGPGIVLVVLLILFR